MEEMCDEISRAAEVRSKNPELRKKGSTAHSKHPLLYSPPQTLINLRLRP